MKLSQLPDGTRPSPNIWQHTSTYEVENRAVDPDGRLWSALLARVDWAGRDVLDVGCGTGFHLPRFALTARSVVGIEPHPDLMAIARRRTRSLPTVAVLQGTAQALPVPDASVDVVHARWAYFFGPGCEPGLAELDRVVRRGGVALVVDNDPTRSTFGGWFRRGYPDVDPTVVERFWSAHGWTRIPVDMGWRFSSRADLESVVRIEFDAATAEAVLAEHEGVEVDYAVNVWSRDF
ncbi:MAG TPA: methyltransferase domain-containing protein [Nocardioides sp.]|uniref:class I SAM-dependent methyltransferase n=1 Tax=uncultured Nocardioides sp. TaxID=198441 RepID=UPI000EC3D122|nr:class I SAM-dependent methyltransferase [uncultured Nocardioides sp.]HCB07245.1 SAM-dependent methyltransferase [Nocardioides sp.]HRD61700.1 methyltransferase domain-containing protein [Nocardioides sp.]HRI97128.1 methyltransferase domain-containing protein [Nocardioides sp.]HRK46277.1 methyltransferase domain-containing protein [Nocardioides sp.]